MIYSVQIHIQCHAPYKCNNTVFRFFGRATWQLKSYQKLTLPYKKLERLKVQSHRGVYYLKTICIESQRSTEHDFVSTPFDVNSTEFCNKIAESSSSLIKQHRFERDPLTCERIGKHTDISIEKFYCSCNGLFGITLV